MISVRYEDSDISVFLESETWEVQSGMIDEGENAVRYAVDNGTYEDHTLTLRTSNEYDVDEDGVTLHNETYYASFVESKGFDVLGASALRLESRLKDRFER